MKTSIWPVILTTMFSNPRKVLGHGLCAYSDENKNFLY